MQTDTDSDSASVSTRSESSESNSNSQETCNTEDRTHSSMGFAEELNEAKELGRDMENVLDSAIQKLTALRNNQNLKETFTLINAFESTLLDFDALRGNGVTSSDIAFRTARASYHGLLTPLEKSIPVLTTARFDVEKVFNVFQEACGTIENMRRVVRDQFDRMSRFHGLTRLPDEILSLIFRARCSEPSKCKKVPFLLASVCRRFRDVARSTPQIWSFICTSWRNQEALKVRLLRSQEVGLEVEIGAAYYSGYTMDAEWLNTFLTLAGMHVRRWTSLKIGRSITTPGSLFDTLAQYLSSGDSFESLPRLHSFEISDLGEPETFFEILERCSPNLRSIQMDMTFKPEKTVKLPTRITRLDIVGNEGMGTGEINIHQFVAMLQSTRIEELLMTFDSDVSLTGYEIPEGEERGRQYTIQSVKRLSIEVAAEEFAEELADSLYFPSLEQFKLAVDAYPRDSDQDNTDEKDEEEDDFARVLDTSEKWFAGRTFSNLKSFSLNMYVESAKNNDGINLEGDSLLNMTRSCPILEDLELECTHWTESLLLPPLRSLTLKDVIIEDSWIQNYGKSLKEAGKLDSFQRLTLTRCKMGNVSLDETEWRRKLPDFGNKVIVIMDKIEAYIKSQSMPYRCMISYGPGSR
ncbi:hypothetical protein SCHPADRAFT_932159 [Schizopora paradoxa]|uniref:Uncharacterized protein n=1 Tax=Schizopora paradoxa TaxID=27342 RepID=A0A0H2REA0_9AGAM|nr:hypothetical protein SCHPADRAFT_932159 [Schizopora paradoxa]